MMNAEYKSTSENLNEALSEARLMEIRDLESILRDPGPYHEWYIAAVRVALVEKKSIGNV